MGRLAHTEELVVDDHGRFRRRGAEAYTALRAAGLPLHDRHGVHGAHHAGVLRCCEANTADCRGRGLNLGPAPFRQPPSDRS